MGFQLKKLLYLVMSGLPLAVVSEELPVEADASPMHAVLEFPQEHRGIQGLILTGSSSWLDRLNENCSQDVQLIDLKVPGNQQALIKQLTARLQENFSTQELINHVKSDIIRHYRQNQYPVVMVGVPEQEITTGVLKLLVTEGKVGKITVKGNRYTNADRIAQMIRLEPGDSINEDKVLQDLSWINTNPFRNASVTYAPGEAYGSTDVWVNVKDRRPVRVYVGGDNTGSRYTGQTRWFTGVNFANFFYPENILSYQFTTANNPHRFMSHTAQFILPLPWRHTLNAFGAYATVNPHLTGFKSTGKSYQASGRYDVPLWFTYPSLQQTLTAGFDFKGTNNNLIFGDDVETTEGSLVNIGQFVMGYHAGVEPSGQKISTGLDLFWSPGQMLPHQSTAAFHTLNPTADAHYVYGKLSYMHEAMIYRKSSLFGSCRLQLTSASLIPSEQMALGGYSTVRGYPERVVNGDNGLCLNVEARTPHYSFFKKSVQDDFYALVFVDFGYAWDHAKVPGLPLTQTLVGIGPGLRYKISSYFSMRFDLGFPLHRVANASLNPHVHLSAILSY